MTLREQLAHTAAILAIALIAWLSPLQGWDDAVTGFYFDVQEHTFPLRNTWLFAILLHDVAKQLPVLVALALVAGLLRSVRVPSRRWQQRPLGCALLTLVIGTVICGLLKDTMPMACPWSLAQFGGSRPHYTLSMLLSGQVPAHAPASHCWPSGHAAGAFGLLGLYFAARATQRPEATWLLPAILVFGALLGWAQVARGAHFPSHVLWSLVICWTVALALGSLLGRTPQQPVPTQREIRRYGGRT